MPDKDADQTRPFDAESVTSEARSEASTKSELAYKKLSDSVFFVYTLALYVAIVITALLV